MTRPADTDTSLVRERANHDRRDINLPRRQLVKQSDPVQLRHFLIECDQVGLELLDFFESESAVRGGADNIHTFDSRKCRADEFPIQGRVINNQGANRVVGHYYSSSREKRDQSLAIQALVAGRYTLNLPTRSCSWPARLDSDSPLCLVSDAAEAVLFAA